MLRMSCTAIVTNYSALPKTERALRSVYIPKKYVEIYGIDNKVDIFVGEALGIRQNVIDYHNGDAPKMISIYSAEYIEIIDNALSTVLKATKNFYDAIGIITTNL